MHATSSFYHHRIATSTYRYIYVSTDVYHRRIYLNPHKYICSNVRQDVLYIRADDERAMHDNENSLYSFSCTNNNLQTSTSIIILCIVWIIVLFLKINKKNNYFKICSSVFLCILIKLEFIVLLYA